MVILRKVSSQIILLFACGFLLTIAAPAVAAQAPELLLGADTINLKIKKHYTVSADGSYRLNLYIKRRILTYKGKKEHADFKFTYNRARQQVKILNAQTTTAQGDIVIIKPEEIHDIPAPWNNAVSLYSQARQMVASLPAVEPGSIIEVELEMISKTGFWCEVYFRLHDPILSKEVIIDAPASFKIQHRTPRSLNLKLQKQITDNTSRYQWQGTNIPALTPERGATPMLEQGFCLLISSFSSWQQVADFFNRPFIAALTPESSSAVSLQLENGEVVNIHQLYRKTRTVTTYNIAFLETDWKIQPPTKTKRLGYGTGCDLALMFTNQLRLHQQPATIVMSNSQNHFLKEYTHFPFPGWWDTALVKSGDDFFLFSSDKPAPGITGFSEKIGLDLESGKLITIKDRQTNSTETKLHLNLKQLPECQGELDLTLKGSAATSWRSQWRDLSTPEREIVSAQFLHQIDPEAKFINKLSFSGLKDDAKDLVFRCKFKANNTCKNLTGNNANHQYLLSIKAPDLPYHIKSLLRDRQQ
ncbi:DUF3857 domain-containing protein, partial [bacterium]|nr:DUF3857 domain-containing protein [bacterium]